MVGADVDVGRDGDAVPDAATATVGGEETDATPAALCVVTVTTSAWPRSSIPEVYFSVVAVEMGMQFAPAASQRG